MIDLQKSNRRKNLSIIIAIIIMVVGSWNSELGTNPTIGEIHHEQGQGRAIYNTLPFPSVFIAIAIVLRTV